MLDDSGKPDSALRRWCFYTLGLFSVVWLLASISLISPACAVPTPDSTGTCDNKATSACSLCTNETGAFASSGSALGGYMIDQMFKVINTMLQKIESTFYNGIVGSSSFQQAIGVVFLLYIAMYGALVMLNMASVRSGEVISRLIKLAIIYAVTSASGWTFFSTWIEQPVVNEMNQLIVTMGNAGSGASNKCSSAGVFGSGGGIATGASGIFTVSLATGPMAMLNGPMSCVFASQFIASILALFTSGSFGWLLALAALWGLAEFSIMVLGAIVTYVKAIVGLAVLFGIAPIFFAFYLFEKTRAMTFAWLSMVFSFALQPVMLFAFLAVFSSLVAGALSGMLTDGSGNMNDVCYVPWYSMPKMFDVYTWRFANSARAAGGMFIPGGSGGASDQLPTQVLGVLYFVVLCNLGKNFCEYINELSNTIAGGSGGGVTTGGQIGNMLKNSVAGGKSSSDIVASAGKKGAQAIANIAGKGPGTSRSSGPT